MPGPGEFSIFTDTLAGGATPLVDRKGVDPNTFHADKTIKGASDPIGAATASQPVADQQFASTLGLFQKCIGIQWGGEARFAMGWTANPAGSNSMKSLDITGKDTNNLSALKATDENTAAINAFGNLGCFVDSMCGGLVGADDKGKNGTPSFVAALDANDTASSGGIAHSSDGKNWSVVFTLPQEGGDGFDGSGCFLVTWDGTQFWAQAGLFEVRSDGEDPPTTTTFYHDILLSSANGGSWGIAGNAEYDITHNPFPEPNALLIAPHLDKRYTNPQGIGAPSGLFGVKKLADGSEIVIHPTANNFNIGIGGVEPADGSTSVTITGGPKPGTADVGFDVACVAYGNAGIWLAAGSVPFFNPPKPMHIAVSTDDGQTWTKITDPTMSGDTPGVVGAFGAPLKSFNP